MFYFIETNAQYGTKCILKGFMHYEKWSFWHLPQLLRKISDVAPGNRDV